MQLSILITEPSLKEDLNAKMWKICCYKDHLEILTVPKIILKNVPFAGNFSWKIVAHFLVREGA